MTQRASNLIPAAVGYPRLGELTGEVLSVLGAWNQDDPMDAYAGYCTAGERWRACMTEIRELLNDHGYTPASFVAEVITRTSYRWAYQTGVLHIDDGCCGSC